MSPQRAKSPDLYKILGVEPGANAADIKKAYRSLAKEYHPDSTGGDKDKETKFKEISAAYDVLGDDKKRSHYDAMRANGAFSGASGFPGGGGFPGGVWDLGELFSQVFSGGDGARAEAAGARRPGGRNVRYQYARTSPFGEVEMFGDERPLENPFGANPARRRKPRPERKKVRASDGTWMTQRGVDVYCDVRLKLDQAILGTVKEVPTLSGTAKVKIPPGTSSGAKLRLKGKGAANPVGGAGDHYVVVHIDVPKQIDEEATALLVQFMRRVGA